MRASDLSPGLAVKVFAFQRWRVGRVLRVGRTRALIEYLTPKGARTKREAWFRLNAIQEAP
jgi:hypothetical protein